MRRFPPEFAIRLLFCKDIANAADGRRVFDCLMRHFPQERWHFFTDDGFWDGSWYYLNRDFHIAAWFRTVDGTPQVKLRYAAIGSAETFETDWQGSVDYYFGGAPAKFSLNLEQLDGNTMKGYLDWKLEVGNSGRFISGAFIAYRTGGGLQFTMHFDNYRRVIRRGGIDNVAEASNTWVFRKACNRLADWDEFPF